MQIKLYFLYSFIFHKYLKKYIGKKNEYVYFNFNNYWDKIIN